MASTCAEQGSPTFVTQQFKNFLSSFPRKMFTGFETCPIAYTATASPQV